MAARPLLLGHRGARRDARENTLEAFELCLAHGCDGFEFDVRLTGDCRAAICHDPTISGRDIASSAYDKLGTPCLEDVLTRFATRAFLDIELKVPGLEQGVIDALGSWPPRQGYFVSSFLPEVIEALYARARTLNLGLICSSRAQLAAWTALPIQALFLERGLCSAAVLDSLHSAGKQVFVWTVNRDHEMRTFADLGVDGLISDDTARLVRTLGSRGAPLDGGRHQER
jgi:glycerophosphoryl diester phosphodiesterase